MIKSMNSSKIRAQFPILKKKINKHQLVYFDNAATTQKPISVINSINKYYREYNANIHRGIHTLAEKATREFEKTRETIKSFIKAKNAKEIIYYEIIEYINEIIFTKGTTEGINLIASTFGKKFLNKNDEIIISQMEHHSNIVPWQIICKEKGAKLKIIPINNDGELDILKLKKLINNKTKFISIVHVSNTLGTINPIEKVINIAKENNIKILIDGAQAGAHIDIDVSKLGCDFYVLSAHKMYGPTGTGIIYGKKEILEELPPYMGGGEMIKNVSLQNSTFNEIPYKFEAGTPNIGDVIAFKESIKFISNLGKDYIKKHENNLVSYTKDKLESIKEIKIVGNPKKKIGIFSFNVKNKHFFDLGLLLDVKGIAIRTGHHCTQPLMNKYGIDGSARISFAIYNTLQEIDYFVKNLKIIINK